MKAGAAKIETTPPGDVWMDGMIREHRSVGVHDPLFARALFLSADGSPARGFVIASVDLCALRSEYILKIRRAAEARTGIPADNIVIAVTHTHSGPATYGFFNEVESGYLEELAEKLAVVIEEAASGARHALVGCGSGREDTISHYRRLLADDGHVVMNWEAFPPEHILRPLGKVDPEVGVLKVVSMDGEAICLLFNHAGHPNVLSGDNYLISADYPGLAARLLEERYGGVAVFVNGAQGTMDIDGLRDRDWAGLERTGRALADAVAETAEGIAVSDDIGIRGAHVEYELPARKISDEEWAWAQGILRQTGGKVQAMADGVGDDFKALLYRDLRDGQDRGILIEQTCIAVGDTALVSFPGELFTEIGMRIKAGSPFRRTYILGPANGCIGYVPTREALSQGGYEVDTRPVDAEAEDIVFERSLGLLRAVYT